MQVGFDAGPRMGQDGGMKSHQLAKLLLATPDLPVCMSQGLAEAWYGDPKLYVTGVGFELEQVVIVVRRRPEEKTP